MKDVYIPIEILESAIEHSRKHNRPVELTAGGLRILSEQKPTMQDGQRLVLSSGPAYHRDYLWHAHYTINNNDSVTWVCNSDDSVTWFCDDCKPSRITLEYR